MSLVTVYSIPRHKFLIPTTAANLLAVSVYVAHQSHNTDEDTVKDVLKDLQDNNIDAGQWVEFQTEKCQKAESSA